MKRFILLALAAVAMVGLSSCCTVLNGPTKSPADWSDVPVC
jgi:hypothetical protein